LQIVSKKGIAFHHSGLHAKQKTLIEEAFKKGDVHIICCTPTICISGDTKIWHDYEETKVQDFKAQSPLFALKNNKLIRMEPKSIQKNMNSSKLIEISSVSGYSIKVTPNHGMLIKRGKKKFQIQAKDIKKSDKIATIGKLDIPGWKDAFINNFIIDNKPIDGNRLFNDKLSYIIGAMLGDGYSGAETKDGKIMYKGSPTIVGIDDEIFFEIELFCRKLQLNCRKTNTYHGTPCLVLGKNKWFREFLVRCGVEKGEEKYISKKLMNMDLTNISWLLKGLFDTDGFVQKDRLVGFSNISEKLIKQIQKLLLRFGIVSRIRLKKAGVMKIYEKTYPTKPHFEILISQKKSIIDFYKHIGFNLKRKQNDLINLVALLYSNAKYVSCNKCNYKIYKDLFRGRSKIQNKWGGEKLKTIYTLGEKGELGSKELTNILNFSPKKKETRLNHHYQLINKRRVGSRSKTEQYWSLNKIGKWIFKNILYENKDILEFFSPTIFNYPF